MSLLTVGEVQNATGSAVDPQALQEAIDREEAWLERRIGALEGERTVVYYLRYTDLDDPLLLPRPTNAVDVVDGDISVSASVIRLLGAGTFIERADASWTGPSVAITFEPNDTLEVKRVVLELVRLSLVQTGYQSERIGEYSYTLTPGSHRSERTALLRELRIHRGANTIRLRSSLHPARVGDVV